MTLEDPKPPHVAEIEARIVELTARKQYWSDLAFSHRSYAENADGKVAACDKIIENEGKRLAHELDRLKEKRRQETINQRKESRS